MTHRIALFQMTAGIDPAANAAALVDAVAGAAQGGAQMLFTPEMSNVLDRDRTRSASVLTGENADPVLAAVRKAAADHGIWVHLGSCALDRGEGKRGNCAFVIDDRGTIRARYTKIHLFDVDLDTGESWRESAVFVRGRQPVVADTPLGPIGLSICYDLRFPALYQALSDAGAQILTVPAAFTVPTGEAHWHILLRARAIENAAFVIAAAQVGTHADGRATYGHSLVVDPWGRVLLDMEQGSGLGFAEIDVALIDKVRRELPALVNRQAIGPVVRA